jgi:16S rRNA (guanine527-N7)-methyltransferase
MNAGLFRELLESRAEAANIALGSELAEKLETYYRLLAHWNNRINLTSLALEPPTAQTVDRLFLEPLVAVSLISPHVAVWFDLGTGGGSPAIPLQLAHPAKRLIMVESRDRKAAFLREVIRELSLSGAEVEVSRIEVVARSPHNAGIADLVTVRAVRMAASLYVDIQALLRFGGQAVLFGSKPADLDFPRGLEELPATAHSHALSNTLLASQLAILHKSGL